MSTSRGKDDLRAQKTRTAIQKAFIQLLCEMDFNSISIAHLMKKAGYSRGAFYLHYPHVWSVYEELTKDYVKDLCTGFDIERDPQYSMDEQALLIVVEVVKAAQKWYPFGKALLNKRWVPDIMPDVVERYSMKRLKEDTVLFPVTGVKYAEGEDDAIAKEVAMRYCVATLIAMFECAAHHVTARMSTSEIIELAEKIYAGNVAWWNYESHMDLHKIKWHEGLDKQY